MSYHPNLSPRFKAAPIEHRGAWQATLARFRHSPSRKAKARLWEALDVLGNACALGTILCAIALWAMV